jgi:hypothetical protein
MYRDVESVPDAAAWLLDEDFAFAAPYETAGEFLGDLADATAHQGTCTSSTVEAIPFLAELARDSSVPAGTRVILLGDLLRLAVTGPSKAVALADRLAASGDVWHEPSNDSLTRQAIARELPSLIKHWEGESDAARFVLSALTSTTAGSNVWVRQRLKELPAPADTTRADILSLVDSLLSNDEAGMQVALSRVSSWAPKVTERLDSPHVDIRNAALSVLPGLVMADVGPTIYR